MDNRLVMLAALVVGLLVDAAMMMRNTPRPIAEFAESFLAVSLYWGAIAASFAAAIYSGMKVSAKTKMVLAGWVVGIVVFFVVAFSASYFTDAIPGVGWRIRQIEEQRSLRRSLINTSGILFHLPSGQINRTIDGTAALVEGRTSNPTAVVLGAPKNSKCT